MASIFPAATLDTPFSLSDALDAIDRGETPAARLRAAADALHAMGFDQVVATLRDASFNATMIVDAGVRQGEGLLRPLPGSVWRRRIVQLERFRVGDIYVLDGSDSWVAREFFGSEASPPTDDAHEWLPCDLVLAMLRGAEGEIIGILKMRAPRDQKRPNEMRRREIEWLARHTASRITYDALRVLATRRAERLQRLQEAGSALARSLDETEIVRELTRQALRATAADGAVLAIPDLDNNVLVTAHRIVRGAERPREPMPLADGVIAQVARTGRPFRIGDRDADRANQQLAMSNQLPSTDDVVGDVGPMASVLAVPLLVGIRLVGVLAVHAIVTEAFSAEDEEVLATMASQAAIAIANARRYAESERERRQTEALADVARAVGESLRLGEVLRLILRHAVSLLGAEGASISLRSDQYMHIVAAVGVADVMAGVYLPVGASIPGTAAISGEIVISNDFANDPRSSKTLRGLARIKRSLAAPLVTARGTIGAISVYNRAEPFTDDDARVLKRLSDQVSVAIVNARLFEEIERATREWKVAFDAIATGMVVLDDDGAIRRCNTRAMELFGKPTIQSVLQEPFCASLSGGNPVQCEEINALLHRAREEDAPARAIIRDEQRGRLVDITAAKHPDGGCVVTFDDVTSVHALAERHRRILEAVSEAIIITGIDRRIVFANPAAHALFGRQNLIGVSSTDLIPPEAREQLLRAEGAAFEGQNQRYELPVLRKNGDVRVVSISSVPLVEVGQIVGSVACLSDVTDQRADAMALARSEARYARLVEAASDAIFTTDLVGRLTSVNETTVRDSGRSREELIGTHCLSLVDPRDHDKARSALASVTQGEPHRVHLRFIDAHKRLRVGSLLATPILENGTVTGSLGVMRDITDEELQREKSVQQEQLASMGRALGGISAELQAPLTSLLTLAELHSSSVTLSPVDRDAVEKIRDEAAKASRIVRQLLGVPREPTASRLTVKLNQLVNETIDLHGYRLRELQIPVRTTYAIEDPAIRGNAGQLQQVLVNLLLNAEEALVNWPGERVISVSTHVERGRAILKVSDTGPGISPDHLPRVFEPLFTTHADDQMRGLGLAVTAAVVKEHDGDVEVQSIQGAGATFTVSLPVVMLSAHGSSKSSAPSRNPSILVVEDEAALRAATQRFLTRHGYDVTVRESGAEALALLKERSFDLVLLDLRLYGMQGDELYAQLSTQLPSQAERVMFMTGDIGHPDVAEFLKQTGRPVLEKPYQLAELHREVERMLEQAVAA